MSCNKKKKKMRPAERTIIAFLGIILFVCGLSVLFYHNAWSRSITAAAETGKAFKWDKRAVREGTTIDAKLLWPDEQNPVLTEVYRDGEKLPDEKMVTVASGSVYHFRGVSDTSVLYSQVYVGTLSADSVSPDGSDTASEQTSQELTDLSVDLLQYANDQRAANGLAAVVWDNSNEANAMIRVQEIAEDFSQTRPDGSDGFTAYTDAVMCEIRLENVTTISDIYESGSNYFLMPELKAFTCVINNNVGILAFTW